MMPPEYESLIQTTCLKFSISPLWAKAICAVESSWDTTATRFESKWNRYVYPITYANQFNISLDLEKHYQATSWGLMQVMGAVARELGFDGKLPDLCKPENGIFFGVKKLERLHTKYSTIDDVAAAYNHGHPEEDPLTGKYVNQHYVDKVRAQLGQLDPGGITV